MYEEDVTNQVEAQPQGGGTDHSAIVRYVLLGVALVYVLASLYFMYTLKGRLDALDQKQQTMEAAQTELTARIHSTRSELKEALTTEVGSTKQELAKRAAELEQEQKSCRSPAESCAEPAGAADCRSQWRSQRSEDRSWVGQDRYRQDTGGPAGNQYEA